MNLTNEEIIRKVRLYLNDPQCTYANKIPVNQIYFYSMEDFIKLTNVERPPENANNASTELDSNSSSST